MVKIIHSNFILLKFKYFSNCLYDFLTIDIYKYMWSKSNFENNIKLVRENYVQYSKVFSFYILKNTFYILGQITLKGDEKTKMSLTLFFSFFFFFLYFPFPFYFSLFLLLLVFLSLSLFSIKSNIVSFFLKLRNFLDDHLVILHLLNILNQY